MVIFDGYSQLLQIRIKWEKRFQRLLGHTFVVAYKRSIILRHVNI